jgi:hypothetical protein
VELGIECSDGRGALPGVQEGTGGVQFCGQPGG